MARCPTCKRPFDPAITASAPFCSERCRDADLRRWLDEKYAFPSERELPDDQWPDDDTEGRE
ncbi:MAG: DNA gyrase inhibitor YacG [Pirellulales bacterium]